MTSEHCADELFRIARAKPSNARVLALLCIAEYNPCRGAEASDLVLLKFRDMPVHNDTASFIFEELAGDVLRRH
jgi:hypothetical protein